MAPREIAQALHRRGTYRGETSGVQRALEAGADFHGFVSLRGNVWTIRPDMARDHQDHANAARIVAKATRDEQAASGDIKAAWEEWSRNIPKLDERGMSLVKAAFEAGWAGGRSSSAT